MVDYSAKDVRICHLKVLGDATLCNYRKGIPFIEGSNKNAAQIECMYRPECKKLWQFVGWGEV